MSTVAVTILAGGLWVDAARERFASRGDAVRIPKELADRLIADKLAVKVDVSKFGSRQRSVLLRLLDLEREQLRTSITDPTTGALLKTRRMRRPPYPAWRIREELRARDPSPAADPVYTAALRALVRRGLLLGYYWSPYDLGTTGEALQRDDLTAAPGSARYRHTYATRLTYAGRFFAAHMHNLRVGGGSAEEETRLLRQLVDKID